MGRALQIQQYNNKIYKKCEICDRRKDIFFRLNVYDNRKHDLLFGSVDMCRDCGLNLADILRQDIYKAEEEFVWKTS